MALLITNQYRSTDLHLKTHTTHRPYTDDVRTCTNTVVFTEHQVVCCVWSERQNNQAWWTLK